MHLPHFHSYSNTSMHLQTFFPVRLFSTFAILPSNNPEDIIEGNTRELSLSNNDRARKNCMTGQRKIADRKCDKKKKRMASFHRRWRVFSITLHPVRGNQRQRETNQQHSSWQCWCCWTLTGNLHFYPIFVHLLAACSSVPSTQQRV